MGAVGEVKKNFKNLNDALRGVQRDRWSCRVQHTLVLILPLHLQAALQSSCEDGHTPLLQYNTQTKYSRGYSFVIVMALQNLLTAHIVEQKNGQIVTEELF